MALSYIKEFSQNEDVKQLVADVHDVRMLYSGILSSGTLWLVQRVKLSLQQAVDPARGMAIQTPEEGQETELGLSQ
jgi:hypothetical protein